MCGRCQKKNLPGECTYIPPSLASSANRSSDIPSYPDPPAPEDFHSSDDASEFPSAVKSTINARLGLPSTRKRCPIPLTDAPMFGTLSIPQVHEDGRFNQADNVLPPRKEADQLVCLYWRCLESLEPLLDHKQFQRSYQALFTGGDSDIGSDYPVFLATLNLMFSSPSSSKKQCRCSRDRVQAKRSSCVPGVYYAPKVSSGMPVHCSSSSASF